MCYRFLKQNPISSGSLPTGDDESEGEQENEEENEEDGEDEGDGTNGMVAPSDALQQHFDADVDDAEGASTASSGLTDAGSNVSFEEEYQNDIEEEVDIPDVEIEQGDGPSEKAEIEEGEGEGDDSSAKQLRQTRQLELTNQKRFISVQNGSSSKSWKKSEGYHFAEYPTSWDAGSTDIPQKVSGPHDIPGGR